MTTKTRAIIACLIIPLVACLVASVISIQSIHNSSDLRASQSALNNALSEWNGMRITHYHLIIEQRISDTWSDPRKNVCRQDVEVKDQAVIAVTSNTCSSIQNVAIPDLFMTAHGILYGDQSIRHATVRDRFYNQAATVENALLLACGVNEAMNYHVEIVYDRGAGYPHLIRYSAVDKYLAEQLATQVGLLPRCATSMSPL